MHYSICWSLALATQETRERKSQRQRRRQQHHPKSRWFRSIFSWQNHFENFSIFSLSMFVYMRAYARFLDQNQPHSLFRNCFRCLRFVWYYRSKAERAQMFGYWLWTNFQWRKNDEKKTEIIYPPIVCDATSKFLRMWKTFQIFFFVILAPFTKYHTMGKKVFDRWFAQRKSKFLETKRFSIKIRSIYICTFNFAFYHHAIVSVFVGML